jgi:hypothetical protein
MIIVKLVGGLGNQMFQYAAGRQLAHLHNTPLLIDSSFLEKHPHGAYTKRELELLVFNVHLQIASPDQIKQFRIEKSGKVSRVLQRNLPILFSNVYAAESGLHFHKQFYNFPENTYLDGFWQSEMYFNDIKSILLKEFVPKDPMNALNEQWLKRISSCESVSLHVRRGDYITPAAMKHHGILSADYYNKALQTVKQKCSGSIEVFIFSDDLHWCKENLLPDEKTHFVDANQEKDFHWDMILMSRCKHNIIANSSFSWWGAWLNQHTEKCVVAPEKWFADDTIRNDNLIPSTWLLV